MVFLIALLTAMISQYYQLPPPGGLFMLMTGMIALYMPISLSQFPHFIGLIALGSLGALAVGCVYSLIVLYQAFLYKNDVATPPPAGFKAGILIDSVGIALILTAALTIAHLLAMPRPYWVPMSCYVVLQGASLQLAWFRHLHRIVGTVLGLILAYAILYWHPSVWGIAFGIAILTFLIESLVVRHYGIAVIFITPLTIIMAEYSGGTPTAMDVIISTRLLDTVLGCLIGLFGAWLLFMPQVRARLSGVETWLVKRFRIFG